MAVTGISKKNCLVISSIIKGATRPESVKRPAMRPTMGLAMRPRTGSAMELKTRPIIELRTRPAIGLATDPKSAKRF